MQRSEPCPFEYSGENPTVAVTDAVAVTLVVGPLAVEGVVLVVVIALMITHGHGASQR